MVSVFLLLLILPIFIRVDSLTNTSNCDQITPLDDFYFKTNFKTLYIIYEDNEECGMVRVVEKIECLLNGMNIEINRTEIRDTEHSLPIYKFCEHASNWTWGQNYTSYVVFVSYHAEDKFYDKDDGVEEKERPNGKYDEATKKYTLELCCNRLANVHLKRMKSGWAAHFCDEADTDLLLPLGREFEKDETGDALAVAMKAAMMHWMERLPTDHGGTAKSNKRRALTPIETAFVAIGTLAGIAILVVGASVLAVYVIKKRDETLKEIAARDNKAGQLAPHADDEDNSAASVAERGPNWLDRQMASDSDNNAEVSDNNNEVCESADSTPTTEEDSPAGGESQKDDVDE